MRPTAARLLLAALCLAAAAPSVRAQDGGPGPRVYLMRGLGGLATSGGVDEIGARIARASPAAVVRVGDWDSWPAFAEDAARHRGAPVVLVGFSMGAKAAGLAADRLAAQGIRVTVIGLDPYCVDAAVAPSPYVRAVNFYANTCGATGRMAGAANVRVGVGLDHLAFPRAPEIQALVLGEALRGAPAALVASRRAGR